MRDPGPHDRRATPGALAIDPLTSIAALAARDPHAPAIRTDDLTWTRAELQAQASRVRASLERARVGAGDVVMLELGRSPEHVAALLGVWAAGAVAALCDPSAPEARLASMRKKSNCFNRLTRHAWEDMPDVEAALGRWSAPEPGALAYIAFTSGTTGEPSAVEVTHAGLGALARAQIEAFDLHEGDVAAWVTSPGFDASISDILTALVSGAALAIPSERDRAPSMLTSFMARHGVTHADLAPRVLSALRPEDAPETLRCVVCGGEPMEPSAARAWARRVRLVNVYGPTEATVCVSLERVDPERFERATLGRPIEGVEWRVIDAAGRDASTGELWLSGACLARGYRGDPERTTRRFVTRDGVRWYRTGDVVERDADAVVFLGRLDRQVQLRGMRTQPEEVEAALARIEGVERAAALVREVMGTRQLVAFHEPGGLDEPTLRRALAATLPGWMVPARVVGLGALPTTASGKPDLRALEGLGLPPAPDREGEGELGPLVALLQAAFERATGAPSCGATDRLVDLGGDSIAALEVSTWLIEAGHDVAPGVVWSEQSPAAIADSQAASDDMCADRLRERAASAFDEYTFEFKDLRQPSPGGDGPILVTGITGWLGARVARELADVWGRRVYGIARAEGDEAARARVARALGGSSLDVTAWSGDVTRPRMGLTGDVWAKLTSECDAVVHCAARVHLVEGYDELEAVNVGGVLQALEFARVGRPKRAHLASTLSVFVATERDTGVALESDDLSATRRVWGGYAQTKFVAEELARRASSRQPVSVYRLGLLTGDSATGSCAPGDFLMSFARALAARGEAPDVGELALDVTPVDWAASVMSALVMSAPSATYHVSSGARFTLDAIADELTRQGHTIRRVPAHTWSARPGDALTTLALCRADDPARFRARRAMDLFQATGAAFDTSRARAALEPLGLWPEAPVDEHTLARYMGFKS